MFVARRLNLVDFGSDNREDDKPAGNGRLYFDVLEEQVEDELLLELVLCWGVDMSDDVCKEG